MARTGVDSVGTFISNGSKVQRPKFVLEAEKTSGKPRRTMSIPVMAIWVQPGPSKVKLIPRKWGVNLFQTSKTHVRCAGVGRWRSSVERYDISHASRRSRGSRGDQRRGGRIMSVYRMGNGALVVIRLLEKLCGVGGYDARDISRKRRGSIGGQIRGGSRMLLYRMGNWVFVVARGRWVV